MKKRVEGVLVEGVRVEREGSREGVRVDVGASRGSASRGSASREGGE